MSEYFKFEATERDFPYYDNNPRISKKAWVILLLTLPISFLVYALIGESSEMIGSLAFALVMLIPLLYFSNWDISLIIHKPTKKEILLAVALFIGYIIYAVVVGDILDIIGQGSLSGAEDLGVNVEMTLSLVFSMLAEELIKFIPLMFFMRLFYRITSNRKLSVIVSTVIILIFFGLLHYEPGLTPIASVLLIQGAGSIFELYGYIKTKNLLVPYISHLLTDAFIFILVMLGL